MALARFFIAILASLIGLVLVAPIFVGAVLLASVGYLTRWFARLLEPSFTPWGELIEFEPHVGWKPFPNMNTHHLAEDVYQASTDKEGWRGKSGLAESDVVVFGDSFAWGYGIDDKDFFADLLPEVRIKTVGTIGYNMVQELLWMRRLAGEIQGKLVVWFIYLGNDLYENLTPDMCGYRMPFVRPLNGTGQWEIVAGHISRTRWPYSSEPLTQGRNYYGKIAEICSRSFLSEKAYPACEYLLREGAHLCRQAGAELIVMTIPDVTQMTEHGRRFLLRRGGDPKSFDPRLPDKQIKRICDDLGVRHVALHDYLDPTDYKSGDCHWNAQGHRKVAELLIRLYRERVIGAETAGNGRPKAGVEEGRDAV